uniref:Uncharacterized protein n=1 Tax=Arundo donax TaxID=35708 RepID=A0A0A9ELJ1_ARUDO
MPKSKRNRPGDPLPFGFLSLPLRISFPRFVA